MRREDGGGGEQIRFSKDEGAGALDAKLIECPICLEAMRNPVSLPCGHSGCRCCLLLSLRRERLCMTCRAPVAADFSRNMKVNISLRDVVSVDKGEQYHAKSVYEGEKRAGLKHGRGVMRYADGGIYDGQWKDDERHGRGVYTRVDGGRYDGQWKDGMQHGRGVRTWADGGRYDGQWEDGKRHGSGVYTRANGARYDGQWEDGKEHGSGVYTRANGARYDGQWENGKQHGRGWQSYPDGRLYAGSWERGEWHGEGAVCTGEITRTNWANGRRLA